MEKKYAILCVDDEENILQTLNRILRNENYKIFLANGGAAGLEVMRREKIDLILCDQKMPQMSGFEVLRVVKKEFPEVMRIMLSGHTDFEALIKTINEGEVFRYLSKPWDIAELKATINSALEQREVILEVNDTFNKVKGVGQLMKDVSIDLNPDQTAILVKVASENITYTPENILEFFDHIFKVLGIDEDQRFQIKSNRIIKEHNRLKLEVLLGKGVKLLIEIQTNQEGTPNIRQK